MSIRTLFGDRYTKKIKYDPYYQRNYVWDNSKATFFIESILLGTDIPPLIFFNAGSVIEVIDGRQRYETIRRFRNGDLKLNIKGLTQLRQLKNYTFSRLDSGIQDIFNDAKIRIFEFEVINEPKLESSLEDKVKKEIFRRYNSGITPLNTAEIDNATYDDDEITNKFKAIIRREKTLVENIGTYFMARKAGDESALLQFLRKYLIMASFPINTYATGSNRSEIFDLLYGVKSSNVENIDDVCENLIRNLSFTIEIIRRFGNVSLKENRLINECLLWAFNVLVEDGVGLEAFEDKRNIHIMERYLLKNGQDFLAENSHHYKAVITRFSSVSKIIGKISGFDYSIFLRDEDFKYKVKQLRQSEEEAKLKLEELSSLRVQKPEPSLMPIEEISIELSSNRFLVRPSYQRQERINIVKASAIIESIILGINLPPIFIFKNKNGVKEVIDGQQRLLSILGFIGKQYQDENGTLVYPKNVNYKLKRLKILVELNDTNFSDLDFSIRDKILDFKLSVVEIDYALNNHFDPVDLFIRLNNKPYPIRENSFEMWNSFMDREIIQKIRSVTDENISWFFIKKRADDRTSDRMLNEELITLLAYIGYNAQHRPDYKALGFFLRENKIVCRIGEKKDVSSLLEYVSTDISIKENFMNSISQIEKNIRQLKTKLDPDDLRDSLTALLKGDSTVRRRLLVDFYMLFEILQRLDDQHFSAITFGELQRKFETIKAELKSPQKQNEDMSYQEYFSTFFDNLCLER